MFLPPLEMRPSSIAPNPAESREAMPTTQHPSPLRGPVGSSLRSPAEVEGTQGSLPQPKKDLKSPSSMRQTKFSLCGDLTNIQLITNRKQSLTCSILFIHSSTLETKNKIYTVPALVWYDRAMTGASHGFSPAAAPVSDFSRGTTGSSESLSCGARDVRSPCVW